MHHRFGDAACRILARYATVTVVLPRHTRGVRAAPVSDAIRVVSRKPHRTAMYLDPSSASIVVQAVVGGVVGLGAFLKFYWRRLRMFGRANSDSTDGTNHS